MAANQRQRWLARVIVTLKPVVNDPQGLAVTSGLHHLGYQVVQGTRVGKYLELELESADEATASTQVDDMCRRLLANTVIENYHFTLEHQSD